MKQMIFAATVVTALCTAAPNTAGAATFAGFIETSDTFFDGAATFDYDPFFLGGSIFEGSGSLDISLSTDLATGTVTLLDASLAPVLDGTLIGTELAADGDVGDDVFSMLFDLSVGGTDYAVATFTGDLDGLGFSDFLTDGVLFADGSLRIMGATADSAAVIPLPAGMALLASGIAGFGLFAGRRRSQSGRAD